MEDNFLDTRIAETKISCGFTLDWPLTDHDSPLLTIHNCETATFQILLGIDKGTPRDIPLSVWCNQIVQTSVLKKPSMAMIRLNPQPYPSSLPPGFPAGGRPCSLRVHWQNVHGMIVNNYSEPYRKHIEAI